MDDLITKIRKYSKPIAIFIAVFGIFFYTLWSSLATKDFIIIPEMFSDARTKSDALAEEFALLSKSTQDNLQKIKELDGSGQTNQALQKIREQVTRGDELKSKGTEMLGSLSQMTYSLGGIRPAAAQALAYEAITYRIEMINGLVAYSNYLDQIMKLLTSKLLYGENIKKSLEEKINSANTSAKNINELNSKFNESIKKLENF